MKPTVIANDKAKNNNEVKTANQAGTNSETKPQTINNLPVSNRFDDKKDEPKKEEPKAETPATPAPQAEQPKAEEAKPQTEPSKKELKEQLREQQERKLADTVKLVEALGKKIAQKNKLQNTIANLDSFNLTQNEQDDMASDSRFVRCELVISDDDGNEFVTKNPFIIAYVAQEVKQLCIDKLADVEASIVIPF
jgi:hypothetical protein